MKKLIAAICFMFALTPLAQAQDKSAPAAEKKSAPAAEKKAANTGEKKAGKAKKKPTEKQLAQRAKMKSCSSDAKDKKLKGKDRKQFMSGCLKG